MNQLQTYLAGPFFNPEQIQTLETVEKFAKEANIAVFSPRLECMCPPGAPMEERVKAFEMNCRGIRSCDFVLARIDDFDPGTVWEVGYAHGIKNYFPFQDRNGIKVYCFTTVPDRGLNLMLAQSSDGFLQGLPSVEKFLHEMADGRGDGEAKRWTKEIQ